MANPKDDLSKEVAGLSEDEASNLLSYISSIKKNNEQSTFRLTSSTENVELNSDLLGRSYTAKRIAWMMRDVIEPPFTIGIFGKWGSGKSIFLDLLEQALDSKYFQIVKFNAWKYESTGNVMYSLYKNTESLLPTWIKRKRSFSGLGRRLLRL